MSKQILSNVTKTGNSKDKMQKKAMSIKAIGKGLLGITGGWPKRMGFLPFHYDGKEIRWLDGPTDFYAWLHTLVKRIWSSGSDSDGVSYCSKNEFYSHICKTVEKYDAIEKLPHYPEFENFYYLWSPQDDYVPQGVHLNNSN